MVGYIDDEKLGRVLVYTRRGMRRASARWDGDHVKLTVPYGLTTGQVHDLLDKMRPGIERIGHTTVEYTIGQVVQCFRCQVAITRQPTATDRYSMAVDDAGHGSLRVPQASDLASEPVKRTISDGLLWLMERFAMLHLVPFATDVARALGVDLPMHRFGVGRGLRKLGHCCIDDGSIQLSRCLMFLPEHLIRYVVCHELAHLQHPDHSPAFHALVNHYTGGREAQLEGELRQFKWPILR